MAKKQAKKEIIVPKKNFGDDGFNVEIYNDIARTACLRDVRLVDTQFKMDFRKANILEDDEETSKNYGGKCKKISFHKDLGVAVSHFEWIANVFSGRSKPLRLKANYIIVYSDLEEKEEEYVHIYVEKLSRFTSYPYFRALFSTLTSAAGLALPPLPTLTDRVD